MIIDPYDEESLIGRGSCYTVKKDHEKAVADFKKVLDFPPETRNAPLKHVLYAVAENYRQLKDFSNALFGGKRRLRKIPKISDIRNWSLRLKQRSPNTRDQFFSG